jgi:hypothetical protein
MSASLMAWEVTGATFGGRTVRTSSGDLAEPPNVQVTIYRTAKAVPPGKKRAVTWSEPVLQGSVMSMEAWKELSSVLAAAGAKIVEQERGW